MADPAPYTEQGRPGETVPSWSSILGGSDDYDEVPALRWPESVKVYHRMRTDSQIDSLMKAVTLPLRRFKWLLDPNGARDEVVEKLAHDLALPIRGVPPAPLPRRRRFNHDDHLRHALLALVYGHMFFNQVGEVDVDLKWRLQKLSPRMPLSITGIQVADDGGLVAIYQRATQQQILDGRRRTSRPRVSSGNVIQLGTVMFGQIPIEVSELVAYVWDREGGNWAGRSLLRPLYRHWISKDLLIRIDILKHERFGAGIPTGRAPAGGDTNEYAEMAQAIQAGQGAGVGLPQGADLFVEGVRGAIPDIIQSIRYHDEQMARDFLAMVLMLGQTQTGSRALGGTFKDLFELSLDAFANWYASITSEHVIEDWVDWNYGEEEPAPRIVWEIDETAPTPINDLINLIDAGVIVVDEKMREYIYKRSSLPEPPTQDEIDKIQEEKIRRAQALMTPQNVVPNDGNDTGGDTD